MSNATNLKPQPNTTIVDLSGAYANYLRVYGIHPSTEVRRRYDRAIRLLATMDSTPVLVDCTGNGEPIMADICDATDMVERTIIGLGLRGKSGATCPLREWFHLCGELDVKSNISVGHRLTRVVPDGATVTGISLEEL